ncbi:cytochrome c oxidase assembly protein [Alloalcanivorax profundimaris]|uniref:cytochrome c oxidase assembly protein n=1 Tax=Alloalcanivorax profundimaris TaxID=2735259 RepID=UPI000C360D87|nr:cytochrome c oxidase assembly protein [Alloalcanivorax profundimaris]MBF1800321.1 cytochrome c oxidase assembly protein [Alloalcanivorax profundimaris]MBM1143573.1 cytochrome c oxidase assembly protein [Alcanivorax sp. ZXX171]MBU59898.1 cytochrome c oxidase assembly protein [Alcanivorax sp.]UWN51194.1 Cytochrome c oxidase assembly protein CtaG [Alcanivorax sp. ALC70]
MSDDSLEHRNKRTLRKLLIWALAMFGFAFAMVPFYDVICDITGLNGKTSSTASSEGPSRTVEDRTVTVEFITQRGQGVNGDFMSATRRVKVHPGEITLVNFYASNPKTSDIVTQSIPSVTPGEAARYLHKTQCFCFDQQTLGAGERKEMPMIFYLDPELPRHINTLTLSYTIFDVTDRVAAANDAVINNNAVAQ